MPLATVESDADRWISWPSWMEIEIFGGLVVGGALAIVALLGLGFFALFLIGRSISRRIDPEIAERAEEWLVGNGSGDLLARHKELRTAYQEGLDRRDLWIRHSTDLDTKLEDLRLAVELFSRDHELITRFLGVFSQSMRVRDFQSVYLETAEYVDSPEGVDCRDEWIALLQEDKQKLEQERERELEAEISRDQRRTLSKHWNSLRKQEPDQQPERELEVEGLRDGRQRHPQEKKKRRKERIPTEVRYAIFERDEHRCLSCGRSPRTHEDVVLHADHIIPESKGGRTVPSNLQTLCEDCNLGKGNRFSTDLRRPV